MLILDDSASAVDTATELCIRRELQRLEGMTKIYIAQRISTVMHADRIVILDGGRIADIGTHSQLLESSPIYREIYESQMKGGML